MFDADDERTPAPACICGQHGSQAEHDWLLARQLRLLTVSESEQMRGHEAAGEIIGVRRKLH